MISLMKIKGEIGEMKKSYSNIVQGSNASGSDTGNNIVSAPSKTIKVEVNEVMERESAK